MKNHQNISSFLGGFLAVLLAAGCLGTALAASGKVTYNFSNVDVKGVTKIIEGRDIVAANGQKIPGTILFTDAAGGKTNYLPIRAISELLDSVEVGYDSATRTVLLKSPYAPGGPLDPNSGQSWVADGYTGGYRAPDGTLIESPHFSELFPGWELPKG